MKFLIEIKEKDFQKLKKFFLNEDMEEGLTDQMYILETFNISGAKDYIDLRNDIKIEAVK